MESVDDVTSAVVSSCDSKIYNFLLNLWNILELESNGFLN